MAMNKYLLIITLNVNGLNAPITTEQLNEQENMTHIYMLSTRDTPQNKRYTQAESEGMEKNTPCKFT